MGTAKNLWDPLTGFCLSLLFYSTFYFPVKPFWLPSYRWRLLADVSLELHIVHQEDCVWSRAYLIVQKDYSVFQTSLFVELFMLLATEFFKHMRSESMMNSILT
ncbi:hypothetical protein BD560DRAFT_427112 [Blakeslea trispora]|nr:hypothetical protein BD560DRAFT_427112 [Blakeslea trispora]